MVLWISAFFMGLLLLAVIPACLKPYGPKQKRAVRMWVGLYFFALFVVLAALHAYLAFTTGTIGFSHRGADSFVRFADRPVLFVLFLPVYIGIPLCFSLLFWGLFSSARKDDGTGG